MTSLPLSVVLSINFWIYSTDFLQLLFLNPSPNFIVLHLCSVLQFIHMKKALWNHLCCNSSGLQLWGKSLSSYQNTAVPTVPPPRLYDRMCMQKVHTHAHDRHTLVGQNTCTLLAQHRESACSACFVCTYHIPQVRYLTKHSNSCFLHA